MLTGNTGGHGGMEGRSESWSVADDMKGNAQREENESIQAVCAHSIHTFY